MKHLFYLKVTAFVFLMPAACAEAQKKMNTATYNRFLTEYKTVSDRERAVRPIPRDTSVHPFAIASRQLYDKNVFINKDIVHILQQLNPGIDMSENAKPVSVETVLVYPNFPLPSHEVLKEFSVLYTQDSTPDGHTTSDFVVESQNFKRLFSGITPENKGISREFYDSLKYCNDKILPYLDNHASSISRLQMAYFIKELKELNYYLTPKKTNPLTRVDRFPRTANANNHPVASYIVEDFWDIVTPFFAKKIRIRSGGPQNSETTSSNHDWIIFDPDPWAPFICNLLIYGKDESGITKKDPEIGSFIVWVGDKMSYEARNNAPNPENYGFRKQQGKASTLPFNVGYGKWIVIMKRDGTGKEYMTEVDILPNIPLSSAAILVPYELEMEK